MYLYKYHHICYHDLVSVLIDGKQTQGRRRGWGGGGSKKAATPGCTAQTRRAHGHLTSEYISYTCIIIYMYLCMSIYHKYIYIYVCM